MLERDGRGAAEHRTKVESMSGTAHESPVAKNAENFFKELFTDFICNLVDLLQKLRLIKMKLHLK